MLHLLVYVAADQWRPVHGLSDPLGAANPVVRMKKSLKCPSMMFDRVTPISTRVPAKTTARIVRFGALTLTSRLSQAHYAPWARRAVRIFKSHPYYVAHR